MKKILLSAVMALITITASAQASPKIYNGQTNTPQMAKSAMVKKSFQAEAPRKDLETRFHAPVGKHLTLDPTKVKPVTRSNHMSMAMQQSQKKAFTKGKSQMRHMVNVKPTVTMTTAASRAMQKAPTFAETYTGMGLNYHTKEIEQWNMYPISGKITDEETGEETEVNLLVDVIPTPDYFKDIFPKGIPVQYTIEDDVITINPQPILSYQNEAQDTTFYVTIFSAISDEEDGVINMSLGEDGKLTITNGNWICFGEFANVEFDVDMSDSEAYLGWDELYANVTYFYKYENTIEKEYNAHAVDYFANAPMDWVMQRGKMTMDDEAFHFFINMSPMLELFSEIYPNGIDVEYEQDGNIITVKPQVIASIDDEEAPEYIMICSGTSQDGNIVLTEGDNGSLTTIEGESVIIGAWSTNDFDPTFSSYLGSYSYMDNVKYRLPDAAPEAPKDVACEPNELILFAGMGLSGYHYQDNLAVMGAYAPVSFRNNTFDIATNFEWSVTEEDEEENTITGNDRDFSFTTKGGALYTDFTLTAYNETEKSEPYYWGIGHDFNPDSTSVVVYSGSGQANFQFSDGSYATMTRHNPDYDTKFYVNFGTPDIAEQYNATSISKIYSYQGKPSTPLFLTGVTLPMVSFSAQDNFELHISLYKCSRSSTGSLRLGDLIAEADATIDNVDDTYAEQSGLTAVVFDELYREDELGMSETLDYLFIEDEFVIVIDDWDNGTFSAVLGSQEYSSNEITSTWFQKPGEERLRSYGGGWPMLFIGLNDATYGYLYTEDNTNLQFSAQGGEKSIHVDPLYYDYKDEEGKEPTYLLSIESITVDGEEIEDLPEWLSIEVANEDYTTATKTTEDGETYEYFVNGIDYDLVFTADALSDGVTSRTAEIVFFQIGAQLKVTINQSGSSETKKGDVNGDGAVDVADISSIINIMADGLNTKAGDVNGDGIVDVADISAVITIMAEK